jgi:flagellar hook assembly protein FlgD
MKRIALLFLLITISVYSQTYYLNVWSKGKLTSIPVSEIKKLTFLNSTGAENISNEKDIIKTFELFQNYPNPFNPSTKIEYQISGAGQVQVHIFNINGELVKTLANTYQSAGKYSMTWNGMDNNHRLVASGIYIYRVVCGNSILSKKMLLIK